MRCGSFCRVTGDIEKVVVVLVSLPLLLSDDGVVRFVASVFETAAIFKDSIYFLQTNELKDMMTN